MGSKPLAPFMDALLMANPLSSGSVRPPHPLSADTCLSVPGEQSTQKGFRRDPCAPLIRIPLCLQAPGHTPGCRAPSETAHWLPLPLGPPCLLTTGPRPGPGALPSPPPSSPYPALWKPLWARTHDAVGEAAILLRPCLLAPQWQVTLLVSLPPDRSVPLPSRTSGHQRPAPRPPARVLDWGRTAHGVGGPAWTRVCSDDTRSCSDVAYSPGFKCHSHVSCPSSSGSHGQRPQPGRVCSISH